MSVMAGTSMGSANNKHTQLRRILLPSMWQTHSPKYCLKEKLQLKSENATRWLTQGIRYCKEKPKGKKQRTLREPPKAWA